VGRYFRGAARKTTTPPDTIITIGYSMEILETKIAGIKLLKPVRHVDSRGFFSEVFKEQVLRENGVDIHFVQDNHSLSVNKGVVRGLHFQIPPSAQAKLLRVTAGSTSMSRSTYAGVHRALAAILQQC
jgi:hypothetical protein